LDPTVVAGTSGPFIPRLVLSAALAAGADRRQFAGIASLASIHDDRARMPMAQFLRLWEVAQPALEAAGGAAWVVKHARPGSLNVLDYLVATGATLADGLKAGVRRMHIVAAPEESADVVRDEAGLTIRYRWPMPDGPVGRLVDEHCPIQWLRLARMATGRHLVPVRAELAGGAPARHQHLVEALGTRKIDFGGPGPSITFAAADANLPLPGAGPALAAILGDYADHLMATARPVWGWLDTFRAALASCLADGGPELTRVAQQLAMGPRTLQRRLRDEGTSWRVELERARQERTHRLLRETPLSVESIAARVGYSDVRALRRAVRRWYGKSPLEVRRDH
jgi:AraC-like DNA-binding protein